MQPIAHKIIAIWTEDFPGRSVPIVLLKNGKPGFVINQWIYWLLEEGTPRNTLDRRIRSVMSLYEFYHRKYGETELSIKQAEHLVADYLDARQKEPDKYGFNWTSIESLKRILYDINLFDEWQSNFHGSPRLNPSEVLFISAWERYIDFKQRSKWDPMLHLYPAKSKTKTEHEHKVRIDHNRYRYKKKIIYKAFPVDAFVDLVERTPNPRDQMLWLLMGGGALRQSEPLHLYQSDILGVDQYGSTRIKLDDPDVGEMHWTDKEGNGVTGTRSGYLAQCFQNEQFKNVNPSLYNLSPRAQQGKTYHAGFKGMTFHTDAVAIQNSDGRLVHNHELFWVDRRFGVRFQQAYTEYFEEQFMGKTRNWPYHPWLIINTRGDNYGMPMTLESLRIQWKSALKRLGMQNCGLGPHSLRHMAGYYISSILKLPIEIAKIVLHHASVTSTETYYHLSSKDVRDAIARAITQTNEPVADYLITPGTKRVALPKNWGE